MASYFFLINRAFFSKSPAGTVNKPQYTKTQTKASPSKGSSSKRIRINDDDGDGDDNNDPQEIKGPVTNSSSKSPPIRNKLKRRRVILESDEEEEEDGVDEGRGRTASHGGENGDSASRNGPGDDRGGVVSGGCVESGGKGRDDCNGKMNREECQKDPSSPTSSQSNGTGGVIISTPPRRSTGL